MTRGARAALAALAALAGCTDGIDPAWQLAHDRIIAVRATPPHVASGETARLDLLIGHKLAPTSQQPPDAARAVSPMRLAGAVALDGTITAPSEAELDAARAELRLPAGAPVPLSVGVSAGGFVATKIVWLGDRVDNPTLTGLAVGGAAPVAPLVVPRDVDVALTVDANDATDIVTWLTSCGTMHDFDLHAAHLRVQPKDPQQGELAVVLRTPDGGVAWQSWPIRAE